MFSHFGQQLVKKKVTKKKQKQSVNICFISLRRVCEKLSSTENLLESVLICFHYVCLNSWSLKDYLLECKTTTPISLLVCHCVHLSKDMTPVQSLKNVSNNTFQDP